MPAMTPTGHADVPDAALVVPPQDADGAQAPDGPEHADGGEAVLLRLVALIAEACFGAGLPRQLRRVQGARAGQRLRDAVEAALVQFLQALEGQLRLLRQQADLLPGAQIAVKFHGRSSLFLLLPAAGRRLTDRPGKGGAGGKAGRAGAGEQGSGKVRFGGRSVEFRKLDACGLQGGRPAPAGPGRGAR